MMRAIVAGLLVTLTVVALPASADTYTIPPAGTGAAYVDVEPSCVSLWQETNNQFGLQKYDIYDPDTGLIVHPKDRLESYAGLACPF